MTEIKKIQDEISSHLSIDAHALWCGMCRTDRENYAMAIEDGHTTLIEVCEQIEQDVLNILAEAEEDNKGV